MGYVRPLAIDGLSERHPIPAVVAYSVGCTWWDDKRRVGMTPSGLPCCPSCGSVLMECEGAVFLGPDLKRHEQDDPGYTAFLLWLRGRCIPRSPDESMGTLFTRARASFAAGA